MGAHRNPRQVGLGCVFDSKVFILNWGELNQDTDRGGAQL